MSGFFIERPVFAWVISICIMLGGIIAINILPVEQYPRIAAPTINISASYPGASSEAVENSVTQVIEQALTGIDHLRYFSSGSDSNGNVTITVTFEPEANPDIAQVQVQNKLQSIMSNLPQQVQQQGIKVTKGDTGFLMVVGVYSDDPRIDEYAMNDFINSKLLDPLSRVPGVGNIQVFGQPYSMRIWLDPHRMASFNLTTTEVQTAITAQNADVSAGQLGGTPSVPGQQLNATITAQSRLKSVGDFEKIMLKVNTDGSQVRLRDVARVELGVQNYDMTTRFNGKPAAGMAITLATGANALNTANLVKAKMTALKPLLPPGVQIVYPFDTTPFVKTSIEGVVHTLIEAVILVFFVMFLFLQNFRATLVPTIAVPVVLLGTFGVMSVFGFSINTLSMFAMVLAIGLLVDDAIVVVENVERIMEEERLSPLEATKKSMKQISSALIGIALVLSAVFVPMAFFKGSTGTIYRQFSITIVSAMLLSVLVALILTPALCASLLRPVRADGNLYGTGPLGRFFAWFNGKFNRNRERYVKGARVMTESVNRSLLGFMLVVVLLVIVLLRIPTAFLPDEDQGFLFVQLSTPSGATKERTLESVKTMERYLLNQEKENIESVFSVTGFSFAGQGQNSAMGFVQLKDWSSRKNKGQDVASIAGRIMGAMSSVKDAMIFAFYPPAVMELGNASGFDLQLVDRTGKGHEALMAARNQLLGMAAKNPSLSGVRPNGLEDVPQFKIDIDHEKASAFGVSIADINSTLQTAWGSSYVNDFLHDGRIKKVFMQGDAPYRMNPSDVDIWHVRNSNGDMVPFSSFSSGRWSFGSPKLERFNGISSVNIQGAPAPGVSSGDAMAVMAKLAGTLPEGFGIEWTGLSYEERAAGQQTVLLYTLSLLFVFLCLAALYESWSVPIAVMLVVPLGVLGTVLATFLSGLSNDVYFKVGLLTTVGLTAKNAILIVEFAKTLYESGMNLQEAVLSAAGQRLRPIVMTSMAFILGVTPLAFSSGAGSASQHAIGIGVIGGMLSGTILTIFFVPLFFILVQSRFARKTATDTAVNQNDKGSNHEH
ncbi:efflux RND transporter permease subunit [Chlorobium phaeobacteroides]|uniref:Transporter, hydrophobe/amphiphile efflux-1 (HAE1) family n=1 Tax=Chlorobium phaeobacteroides (strain DSM 266 / SMG 266 / 2430) TaxID=290317 RepID=A1BEK1_CHLPD|nr:efflux RND transporter permease subunit [Chlorobium phaeobacteroides]ABL64828.1 transporter, hydrophobe/amphiphile efflux-1 (HAE1) family [Chlorobium phaeobacteroides DSM 266]